jgi:hypothetical protein
MKYFNKGTSYGHIGLKGTPSNNNKIFGGSKYNGIDLFSRMLDPSPNEKKTSNYLEKK